MTWVKLSDDYYEHAKFEKVSYRAELLWIRGLAKSNHKLTDGFLTPGNVARLASDLRAKPERLAGELVAAGLWEASDGGFLIHNYLVYQPPAAAAEATRAARSAAGRIGAARRWGH